MAYAITIHKSQGLSLDCAIIDLSERVFGEGMAYVALSRIRSLNGVHLTSFTPDAIMASRACVEECNRLREQFRPDLPLYQLPSKRLRMTGAITPPAKRPCTDKASAKHETEDKPQTKKPKIADKIADKMANEQTDQSSCDDCFIVDWPQHTVVRERFPFNPLDVTGQKRGCKMLKLNYHHKNVVSVGGPDVPLTEPDRSTLVDTVGDGSCMFRAMSVVITGNQRQHVTIRRAIVKHLCDNEQLFIQKSLAL